MGDGKLVINIPMPVERSSILDEIKALPKITAPPKRVKPEPVESEPLILSSVGKKKDKKKKDKKKKSGLDAEFISSGRVGNVDEVVDSNEDAYDQIITGDNLIDIDDLLYGDDDDDDSVSDNIIDTERRGYESRKKDTNPFKKEFAEELTLLYDLLEEFNKFSKELDKKYKAIEGSKVRGTSKYTNELITNILSAKTSKLHVLKEIASLKKTIADLKIKIDAKTKEGSAEKNTDLMATQYFQKVLNYGRGNFIKEFGGNGNQPEVDDEIDDVISQIEQNKGSYNDDEMDNYQNLINQRLANTDNPFRTSDGTKLIHYETLGVKIFVKKCIDTGEWEFVALDRDNQQIYDYPVPTRSSAGKVKFSDGYASDSKGRSYKVIEYYSPDADDDDE
jgi:hypothetical protein